MPHPACTCDSATATCPRYGWMKGAKYAVCRSEPSQRRDLVLSALARPSLEGVARREPIKLGTLIQEGLTAVGVTSERVETLLGAPCGCKERAEKLDQLSAWASRVVGGKIDQAKTYLASIFQKREDEL